MKIPFIKMQSCGNDYIYITENITLSKRQMVKLCDRNYGIGSDGVVIISNITGSTCDMTIYNNDGSLADMCGNATRCVAKLIASDSDTCVINSSQQITVNCQDPYYTTTLNATVLGGVMVGEHIGYRVDVGNKHIVEVLDNLSVANLNKWSDYYLTHNIMLAKVTDKHNVQLIIRERGSGITLACGSGAVATMAVLTKLQLVGDWCNIHMPGGTVKAKHITANRYSLTGDAVEVYRGSIEL